MKPLIGISVDCKRDPDDFRTHGTLSLNWNYAEAVADAGGVPILIPPMADMETLSKILHGWLIPGGNDIDAAHWGAENHPKSTLVEPARFEGERRMFSSLGEDVPIFGICYGCQFLNVVRGGTIEQHVPDRVGHESHSGGTMQEYPLENDSRLAAIVGTNRMTGKSYHHQAIETPAAGLKVVSRHTDGTIEAIEATDRPWMFGVQWHPERTLDDDATRKLFEDFVLAARHYAEKK